MLTMLRQVVVLNPLVLMSDPVTHTQVKHVTSPLDLRSWSQVLTFGHHFVEDPLQLEGTDLAVLQRHRVQFC